MDSKIKVDSLRQTARSRLLHLVDSVPGERKIVILDEWTVKVIDSVCTLHDILDSGAFLVEIVSKKRQQYPTMQAVYFVSPSVESFDLIARDFEAGAAPYSEVHILATGRITDEQMQRLANSPVVSFVKTLKEVYLDFLAIESRVFTTGSDARLLRPGYAGQGAAMGDLDQMARQIAAACVTMGERPIVRYHKSTRDPVSSRLASILNEMLDKYYAGNSEFRPRSSNSELVVVSRTFDLISPLLHEFTYQAMIMDLLTSEGRVANNKYKQGEKLVSLDESDSLWTALRHVHIADCSRAITDRFRRFVEENKAASQQLKNQSGSADSSGIISLSQLKEVMGALGEFQEQKSQFTLHMDIAEKCFAAMDGKQLMDMARVEQNLACACDAQGEAIRDPWGAVAGILGRTGKLSSSDRARLICLYFACSSRNPNDSEKSALINSAKLDKRDADAANRYLQLLQGHWRPAKGQRKSRFERKDEEKYEVSRFVPQLQLIVEDACCGALDPQVFPAVTAAAHSAAQQSTQSIAAPSLRARTSEGYSSPSSPLPATASRSIWMFVVGGATWSEARAVYQTASRRRIECFLGSTHMIHPESFLSDLAL